MIPWWLYVQEYEGVTWNFGDRAVSDLNQNKTYMYDAYGVTANLTGWTSTDFHAKGFVLDEPNEATVLISGLKVDWEYEVKVYQYSDITPALGKSPFRITGGCGDETRSDCWTDVTPEPPSSSWPFKATWTGIIKSVDVMTQGRNDASIKLDFTRHSAVDGGRVHLSQILVRRTDQPYHYLPWLWWYYTKNYHFHAGWLWFLPALFIIGLLNAPLFLFGEKREPKYAVITGIFFLGTAAFLVAIGFTVMFAFWMIFGPCVTVATLCYKALPVLGDKTWSRHRYISMCCVTGGTMLSHVGMILNFRYADLNSTVKALPALLLFCGHYYQGYFMQRWESDEKEMEQAVVLLDAVPSLDPLDRSVGDVVLPAKRVLLGARLGKVVLGGALILAAAIGSPNGAWEEELFPLYSASYMPKGMNEEAPFFGAAHVVGCWAYIGLCVPWFAAYIDSEIHPAIYKHASASTMVVYIFHFCFIVPFVFWVIRDFGIIGLGGQLFAPALTFGFGSLSCVGVYVLLLKFPAAGRLFGL